MQVILLQKIKNVGALGELVKVKPGYARNYLIPQGKAARATAENIRYFEDKLSELQAKEEQRLQQYRERAEKLNGVTITIAARASDEGKLYGSVGLNELVKEIFAATQVEVKKQELQLAEGVIRNIGDYEVQVNMHHGEIVATVNILVTPSSK